MQIYSFISFLNKFDFFYNVFKLLQIRLHNFVYKNLAFVFSSIFELVKCVVLGHLLQMETSAVQQHLPDYFVYTSILELCQNWSLRWWAFKQIL